MPTHSTRGGNRRLEEAIQFLIQTQAAFMQNQAAVWARFEENDRRFVEHEKRLEAEIMRLLQELPETIRQKIGFRSPD
jgi:hypothetical protein